MKYLPLSQGKKAIVDDEDFDFLNQWKWSASVRGRHSYAVRRQSGTNKILYLHRELLGVKKRASHVDHKNGDPLDNRRSNLRICSHTQNLRNRGMNSRNSSGFKGVTHQTLSPFWVAQIGVDGKRLYLGTFKTKIEAAQAYDEAALKHHGRFAVLNFPHAKS